MTDATTEALRLLIAERDRINSAIELLQGGVPATAPAGAPDEAPAAPRRRGRPPGSKNAPKAAKAAKTSRKKRGRREMTAAEKKIVSDRMKAYWAARRKGKKGKK